MSDNGEILTIQWGKGKDTTYGGQFLTGETAYDTSLTEEGLDGRIR